MKGRWYPRKGAQRPKTRVPGAPNPSGNQESQRPTRSVVLTGHLRPFVLEVNAPPMCSTWGSVLLVGLLRHGRTGPGPGATRRAALLGMGGLAMRELPGNPRASSPIAGELGELATLLARGYLRLLARKAAPRADNLPPRPPDSGLDSSAERSVHGAG